jgi:hypothetical protein
MCRGRRQCRQLRLTWTADTPPPPTKQIRTQLGCSGSTQQRHASSQSPHRWIVIVQVHSDVFGIAYGVVITGLHRHQARMPCTAPRELRARRLWIHTQASHPCHGATPTSTLPATPRSRHPPAAMPVPGADAAATATAAPPPPACCRAQCTQCAGACVDQRRLSQRRRSPTAAPPPHRSAARRRGCGPCHWRLPCPGCQAAPAAASARSPTHPARPCRRLRAGQGAAPASRAGTGCEQRRSAPPAAWCCRHPWSRRCRCWRAAAAPPGRPAATGCAAAAAAASAAGAATVAAGAAAAPARGRGCGRPCCCAPRAGASARARGRGRRRGRCCRAACCCPPGRHRPWGRRPAPPCARMGRVDRSHRALGPVACRQQRARTVGGGRCRH